MDPDPDRSILLSLFMVILLTLVNAFFAAAEIALVAANESKMKHLAEEGDKRARKVVRLLSHSANFLATVQIGVTVAGFLSSAFAADKLADPLAAWLCSLCEPLARHASLVETLCVIAVTILLSFFSIVFGEQVPKSVALRYADRVSLAFSGVLSALATLFRPFVWLISGVANLVLRLLGINPDEESSKVTEEDIRLLADEAEEKGVLEEEQRDMLNNVFEFDDTTAGERMTPRTDVEAIEVNDPVSEALALCVEHGYSRLPVYEEDIDHVVGLLYVKDLLPYVGKALPAKVTIRSLLRETYFAPETMKCSELLNILQRQHIQMAVVVDEYGGAAGIVTVEDLVESIVGNIQDELDHEEAEIRQIDEHSFDLDGALTIDEVNEQLDTLLPEGDYDTLAGFLMAELGHIPTVGESVCEDRATFTVTEMEDRRVTRVHAAVEPPPAPDTEE